MVANFELNQSTSNGWKSSFRLPYANKKVGSISKYSIELYYEAKILHAKISFQ